MADSSIYELEDIIWDEFEHSGDHIVPQPSNDHGSDDKYEGDSCKKPRHEERDSKTLNKEKSMMEKDSWSQTSDGVFPASGDADMAKDISSLQSGDTKLSDDLNLFSNDGDDKESSGFLYYGWPEIGNVEDMDKMLSNGDSSFGLGVTGNANELVWFTSEDPAGGYEDVLKMDLKFPCLEPSALTNVSHDHEPQGSDNTISGFVSEIKDDFKVKDQKQQSRQLKCSNVRISSSNESDQVFTSISNQQQHKILGNIPMQATSGSMITAIKSENIHGTVSEISGKNKLHHAHAIQPSFSKKQKQFHMSENKIKSQSDMEGVNNGVSPELGLLDVPEGSSVSSELDEISLEATSFCQLQQVMEQLDLRTKLCIRDSLYRLARSAEQRHNYAGISNSIGTGGPLTTEGTNKCTGFMDMETDTNPIDRTVAHLLFHRPSDSSNMPIPLPYKPNVKVDGSTMGPPVVAEKPSSQKVGSESDDKISRIGKK